MKSIFHSTARNRRHRQAQSEQQQIEQQPFFAGSGHNPLQPKPQPFFQPKLAPSESGRGVAVGKARDHYEHEADAVADAVVNHNAGQKPVVQRQPITPLGGAGSLQRLATPDEEKMPSTNDARMEEDKAIQEKPIQKMEAPGMKEEEKPVQTMGEPGKEEEEPVQKMEAPGMKEEEKPVQTMGEPGKEEEKPVQAKSQPGARPAAPSLGNRLSQKEGNGNPLPKNVRSEMEHSFGVDFNGVNIHTDSEAIQMNRELGAQAFTHGRDVYFNSGKFSPEQSEGKHLLAHELTHVVQQRGQHIRRKPDPGINLKASRFSGDANLEAVLDGKEILKKGSSGAAVKKIQLALIEAGFSLPKFGADGLFGPETKAALEAFQVSVGLIGDDKDGILGPDTMTKLDEKFAQPVPPPMPPMPPPPGPLPPGPKPLPPAPAPPAVGLTYEQAKLQIQKASKGAGTKESKIYDAIRKCTDRQRLKSDYEIINLLRSEMSKHELWKAMLLLEYGNESNFPLAIKEIVAATDRAGTDEDRIYKALQGLSKGDKEKLKNLPVLWELLEKDLNTKEFQKAFGIVVGTYDYKVALQAHKDDIVEMGAILGELKTGIGIEKNTGEWLDSSLPSGAKNDLHVCTETHDSVARANFHGQFDNAHAYFGAKDIYPADAGYDEKINSKRNIIYAKPPTAAEHLRRDIWVYDPKKANRAEVKMYLVHEVQHDADRHDDEPGANSLGVKEKWVRYKTEFRAYWMDGRYNSLSDVNPPAGDTEGWKNERQKAIYDNMVKSGIYNWLPENMKKNKKVDGTHYKDMVLNYSKPEGVNLYNSRRINDFYLKLKDCKPRYKDFTKSPLLELETIVKSFTADDQTQINAAEATVIQTKMKKELSKNALVHIATLINGGTLPTWASK